MNVIAHPLTVAAELSWKRESLSGASLRPSASTADCTGRTGAPASRVARPERCGRPDPA